MLSPTGAVDLERECKSNYAIINGRAPVKAIVANLKPNCSAAAAARSGWSNIDKLKCKNE